MAAPIVAASTQVKPGPCGEIRRMSGRADSSSHTRIAFLDGIRGLSALYVLVMHCALWGGYRIPLPNPKLAVDVFMVMSGYLMVHQWSTRDPEYLVPWREVRGFWLRRFFRIAPLYYFVLAVSFLAADPIAAGYSSWQAANPERWAGTGYLSPVFERSIENLAIHASFLFGLLPQGSGTLLPDWSIGLEMQFYAAFPLALMFIRRFGYVATCLVGVVVGELAFRFLWTAYPEPSFLALKAPVFLIGMTAAMANRWLTEGRTERGITAVMVAVLVAASVEHGWPGVMVALTCLLIACVQLPAMRPVNDLLGGSAGRFLAETSYAVYLIHGTIIALSAPFLVRYNPATRTFALIAVTIGLSYGISYVLYRCVEMPGIALGRYGAIIATDRSLPQSALSRSPIHR